MPRAWPGFTRRAGEDQVVGGAVHAGVEPLGAVDDPVVAVRHGRGLQPGGIGAVVGFGQPERHRPLAGDQGVGPLLLLRVGAEPVHHDDLREVADDRRLVLQVVVQPETLVRQVFPDDRHVDVAAVAAAELRRADRSAASPPRRRAFASRRAGPPTPAVGMPPLSQSVRAYSRRWSKYCMFSRSSGLISASMNASISASRPGRCSGRAKSTVIPLSCEVVRTRTASSSRSSQRRDGVLVVDLQAEARAADEDRGEVLEQQRDGGGGVLWIELGAVALLLGPPHGRGDDVHAEAPELVLHVGESRSASRPAGRRRS